MNWRLLVAAFVVTVSGSKFADVMFRWADRNNEDNMSAIKPSDSTERLLGYFRKPYDWVEKQNMAGAQRMSYPEELLVAIKLRDLLLRGIEPERIGWCQVSKSFFVVVRN